MSIYTNFRNFRWRVERDIVSLFTDQLTLFSLNVRLQKIDPLTDTPMHVYMHTPSSMRIGIPEAIGRLLLYGTRSTTVVVGCCISMVRRYHSTVGLLHSTSTEQSFSASLTKGLVLTFSRAQVYMGR